MLHTCKNDVELIALQLQVFLESSNSKRRKYILESTELGMGLKHTLHFRCYFCQ